jgi:uncharacterized protein (TIGR00369 family)
VNAPCCTDTPDAIAPERVHEMNVMNPPSTHFERVVRSCMTAKICRFLRKEITIQKAGLARVAIPFHPDLTQNWEFLHAAVLFEVGDSAGFVAVNSMEETYSTLTVDFHINLVRPVQREGIYAIGEVLSAGKTLYVARSNIYTSSGKLAATGQGTYMVTKVRHVDLDGYND